MRVTLAITMTVLMTGCGYFSENRSGLFFSSNRVFSKAELNYATVKQKIFLSRCEGCHNEARPRHGIRVDTFEQVKLNLQRIVQSTLVSKSMPVGQPLSDSEMALLQAWVEAGAPETTTPETSKESGEQTDMPVPGIADFDYIRGPLFQKHLCYTCHVKGQHGGDVVIDKLEALLDPRYRAVVPGQPDRSVLIRVLEAEDRKRMPPISSGAGLQPSEVKLVRDWIARGAPAVN